MLDPKLATVEYLARLGAIAADTFTIRIHARILEKGNAWTKLWYFLRGLDVEGSGYGVIDIGFIIRWLGASESTIYEWLRDAKKAGAIRRWRCQRGKLFIRLGGFRQVTRTLELKSDRKGIPAWGVTAEVSLFEIHNLKALATLATAQRLQQLSRFAAWQSLPKPAKRIYKRLPQPGDFFPEEEEAGGFSHDLASGNLPPCTLHIGKRRVFVSKGFVPFGTSQNAIAQERGYSDRQIQRHLKAAGVASKQVVQCKAAYRLIDQAMEWEGSVQAEENIYLHHHQGNFHLTDQAGNLGKTHTTQLQPGRIFKYLDRYWLYRTNLYNSDIKLCTMRAARRRFSRENVLQESAAPGDSTACNVECFERVGSVVEKANPG